MKRREGKTEQERKEGIRTEMTKKKSYKGKTTENN